VSASAFGVIRGTESVLGIGTLLAACGMPSLIVKYTAEVEDLAVQGRILIRLLHITLISSAVTASMLYLLGPMLVSAESAVFLRRLVVIVCVTACGRTCLNYLQGARKFQLFSVLSAIASLSAFGLLMAQVTSWGLNGWVLARYTGEALFLAAGLWGSRHALWAANTPDDAPLLGGSSSAVWLIGVTLSSSLLVRTALDNVAILSLSRVAASADVGRFGLAAVICAATLVIPAAIGAAAFPRLARARNKGDGVERIFFLAVAAIVLATTLIAACLVAGAPFISIVFGAEYKESVSLLRILSLASPFRGLTSLCGTLLLVYNEAPLTLKINALLLMVAVPVFFVAARRYGATGVACCTLALEVAAAAGYMRHALLTLDKSAAAA